MTSLPFSALQDRGVLWLVNRVVFHPRGFALALHYDDGAEEPSGWSLLGDGSEVWVMGATCDEDELLRAVERLFAEAGAERATKAAAASYEQMTGVAPDTALTGNPYAARMLAALGYRVKTPEGNDWDAVAGAKP